MNLYSLFVTSGLLLLITSIYFFVTNKMKWFVCFIILALLMIFNGLFQNSKIEDVKVHDLKLAEYVSNYNEAVKEENGFPYFALHLKSFKKTILNEDEWLYTYVLNSNETLYVTTQKTGVIKKILLKGEFLNEKEAFSESSVHKAFVVSGVTKDTNHAANIIIYLMNQTDGNKDYDEGYVKYNLKYNLNAGDDLTIYYN